MPYPTKDGVARLMSAANYPRTKLLFDEYKRALEEREKAEATIRRSQANLTRENERVARLSRSLESLRSQLALLRGLPAVDLNQLLFLQEQIRSTAAALAAAEAQEAKAAAALDRTQGSAEATLRRADEARDAYVAALTAYEKPLAEIRALAMSIGSAL
jgi:chromosome segregation ATPase